MRAPDEWPPREATPRQNPAYRPTGEFYDIHSPHLATCPFAPHGMIGTLDVEFSGLPSISLSV